MKNDYVSTKEFNPVQLEHFYGFFSKNNSRFLTISSNGEKEDYIFQYLLNFLNRTIYQLL